MNKWTHGPKDVLEDETDDDDDGQKVYSTEEIETKEGETGDDYVLNKQQQESGSFRGVTTRNRIGCEKYLRTAYIIAQRCIE